jgi:hydrogenase nickel incorporation protein HypA/HybF
MHSALEAAKRHVELHGGCELTSLELTIGTLSGVVPESLEFAFMVLKDDFLAKNATLTIHLNTPRCWCETCQDEFKPESFFPLCDICGTYGRFLEKGSELLITSLQFV